MQLFGMGPLARASPVRPYHSVLSPRGMHNHFPNWRGYREYSGGGHTDMGAHHYDIAMWALGLDQSGPLEILPPEGGSVDHPAQSGVRYRFEGGLEVVHGGESGCVFYGERGSLRLDRGHLSSDPIELTQTPLDSSAVKQYRSPGHHRKLVGLHQESREAGGRCGGGGSNGDHDSPRELGLLGTAFLCMGSQVLAFRGSQGRYASRPPSPRPVAIARSLSLTILKETSL